MSKPEVGRLQVLFSPAEFNSLRERDLSATTCVVIDILRATTSIVTALENGAREVIPVETIEEALRLRTDRADLLLAGERNGFRITRELTGGADFDFGNSPREFTPEAVAGRSIAITTTNGSRALRACARARQVIVGCFLNLGAVAELCRKSISSSGGDLLVICSGTYEEASFEDNLAAGALCDRLLSKFPPEHIADSAQIAREVFMRHGSDLLGAMRFARNGRRLLSIEELKADVPFCLRIDTSPVAGVQENQAIVKVVSQI